jgi:hypothetical protein
MTEKLLRLYRELAHTALFQYPNAATGQMELRRVRDTVRLVTADGDDLSFKRACAFLRYSINEMQATIQLAKYRNLKRAYYTDEQPKE